MGGDSGVWMLLPFRERGQALDVLNLGIFLMAIQLDYGERWQVNGHSVSFVWRDKKSPNRYGSLGKSLGRRPVKTDD